jgi:phosphoribosylaminoimidazole carboxylase PurE protein
MSDIGIILGSDTDLPKIRDCIKILEEFGVSFEIIISSAHRTPEQTHEWAKSARAKGLKVIIAVAGGAAHLPGVVAAQTTLPVIGVPVETPIAGGLDSILSILQMPSGIPVATMAAGKSGGINAALFAITILAISNEGLLLKLEAHRKKTAENISDNNKKLKSQGYAKYIDALENEKDP